VNFRQFVRGYAVTSYASQGKTVDYVLFSDSAVRAATNDQQWYVTISRGRKGVRIFSTDKAQFAKASPAPDSARWRLNSRPDSARARRSGCGTGSTVICCALAVLPPTASAG